MKLFRSLLTLMLLVALAMSCKTEKKEAGSEDATAVEESTEVSEQSETSADTGTEAVAETDASAEEEESAEAEKKITVVYPRDSELEAEVKEALKEFAKDNPEMKKHFNDAYAFAVYPKITKGGLGIGGAGGKGLVFDNKTVIGESKLAQATFGLQAGGQTYMEAIFFEDQPALDRFTGGKIKFSG